MSGPTLYSHQAQSISCSALAQLADIQQQQQQQQQGGGGGGDRMSRSLTCLGLAGTIPEGVLQRPTTIGTDFMFVFVKKELSASVRVCF